VAASIGPVELTRATSRIDQPCGPAVEIFDRAVCVHLQAISTTFLTLAAAVEYPERISARVPEAQHWQAVQLPHSCMNIRIHFRPVDRAAAISRAHCR
jgi:hypothetical protein